LSFSRSPPMHLANQISLPLRARPGALMLVTSTVLILPSTLADDIVYRPKHHKTHLSMSLYHTDLH
jgi:hypothetical protein